MSNLTDKIIWITGASSGIGEALTYEFANQNAKVILSARRKEELERVKANCPVSVQNNIFILPLDLAHTAMLQNITAQAIRLFGHIDILVNNGGVGQRSLILETSLEVDKQIMEVNFFGTITLTKSLLPHFIQRQQGHYVTVTSLTGKFGTPFRSAYAASKHALHGFFDALRAEHWKDNIKVTMICPGFIQTNLSVKALTGERTQNDKTLTHYKKKSAEWCARKIVVAIERQQEEVYIGGKEVFAVYLKRFFPTVFSKIIRKVPVR
ncbi:SDR family oxidoreductase [Chryseolinea sp. H1M3-3]|uniref:SDR family oxidoreductase n=1 Tax=Chryseolinea sp. H1M3-3 TaxID=3034144 RepID=UPI0023EC09A4|nr:SDR family oxidoreductase [Chryseolinea sp. H1M3-3]